MRCSLAAIFAACAGGIPVISAASTSVKAHGADVVNLSSDATSSNVGAQNIPSASANDFGSYKPPPSKSSYDSGLRRRGPPAYSLRDRVDNDVKISDDVRDFVDKNPPELHKMWITYLVDLINKYSTRGRRNAELRNIVELSRFVYEHGTIPSGKDWKGHVGWMVQEYYNKHHDPDDVVVTDWLPWSQYYD